MSPSAREQVPSADFYDSAGDDTFTGAGATATLTGPGYSVRGTGFNPVRLHKTQGGTDRKFLDAISFAFAQDGTWI